MNDTLSQGNRDIVILGGGPAGLTAAWLLLQPEYRDRVASVTVLERDSQVGGIAKTINYKGYYFDLGGHRFFTKSPEVENIWHAVLGDRFLRRPRLSRIYYRRKFFNYPIKPMNALVNLGLLDSFQVLLSYARAKLFPRRPEKSFEDWITNRFGYRLYMHFFKTYTEKVWGIPCSELSAEWAAQRIQGLSLITALINAFFKPSAKGKAKVKTLIDEFDYPEYGPGQMWQEMSSAIQAAGGKVILNAEVVGLHRVGDRVSEVVYRVPEGERHIILPATDVLSTLALKDLAQMFEPVLSPEARAAGNGLQYRDFMMVSLIIDKKELFPDNWIYIHAPEVQVGRIQNFKNWSPSMVPDPEKSCLGMEYFLFAGDALWNTPDAEVIKLAAREAEILGFCRQDQVLDGKVARVLKTYPTYNETYAGHLAVLRAALAEIHNLQCIGRNGQHRYNNMDHSMMTAILAVKNLFGGGFDIWSVNADAEYHEEKREA